jgi:uncharacterized protein YpmS
MTKEKETKSKKLKKWIKPLLISLLTLIVVGGALLYKSDLDAQARREAFQEQQDKMVDFWKEQGLTDEEIQEKLAENRAENLNYEPSLLDSLLRTFRHATGTGPGGGEPGTMPPPGGGMGDGSGMGRSLESK